MKRILFIVIAAIILIPLAIIGYQLAHDPGGTQGSSAVADPGQQVAKGEYLTRAGNCMACHTARDGKPYAGGRQIATPFGNIYTSNITPDKETGIGAWTADDFWRAIHNGKSKDGKFLYPAFPYPNYTKVSREDADAMFAYLKTVEPARQANKEHELRFPYNQRILLTFWRTLYFTPGEFQEHPIQSKEWNRGAYLVQGLGHCAACHTSRNALGGTVADSDLGGGMIPMQNWHASSLTSGKETGLGEWSGQEIASLLKTGVSHRGAAFGPMAEVVASSLQHLSDSDIQSMSIYLKSLPERDAGIETGRMKVMGDVEAVLKQGAAIYEKHCVECHQENGKGVPPAYPPLAGNRSLTASSATNPVRIILNGGYPPSTGGNPRPYGMPPFSMTLSDQEIAAVASYIRMSWGNKGSLVSSVEVSRFRGAPIE